MEHGWNTNCNHDLRTREEVKNRIELGSETTAPGTREHIFCTLLQFSGWYHMLLVPKGEVSSYYLMKTEKSVVKKPMSKVKTMTPHYARSPGNYTSDVRPKGMGHTSLGDMAVRF